MVCFLWHNLNCCKFIMPWPRYRMNSCWLLKWFKCILQVIRVLDAHIKGEPILCLVSLRLTFSSSDLCSHLVRMSFSWVRYINSIQIGDIVRYKNPFQLATTCEGSLNWCQIVKIIFKLVLVDNLSIWYIKKYVFNWYLKMTTRASNGLSTRSSTSLGNLHAGHDKERWAQMKSFCIVSSPSKH
jgi:hypothetical protein